MMRSVVFDVGERRPYVALRIADGKEVRSLYCPATVRDTKTANATECIGIREGAVSRVTPESGYRDGSLD